MLDTKTHIYYDAAGRAYDSVTTILEEQGFIKKFYKDDVARFIGEQCHLLTHAHDAGRKIVSAPAEYLARLEQYKKFKKDTGFEVEFSEVELINPVLKYAGTVDRFGRMNGERWVIDLKFSSTSAQIWHEYQTAGYAVAAACQTKTYEYAGAKRGGLIIRPDRYLFVPHTKIENATTKWTAICVARNARREASALGSKFKDDEQEDSFF